MPSRTGILAATLSACTLALALPAAAADPPILSLPDDELGAPFWAAIRLVEDLEQPYVEEEFFLAGTATVYNYRTLPPVRGDIEPIPAQTDLPYKTRFVVRRPADPADFNGTVVIEWMNSTSGFDVGAVWDTSAEYFARKGVVYVGWTNSNQSLAFLLGGCQPVPFLPATCATRYQDLLLSDNGQAYEIGNQLARLFRDPQTSPLPEGYDVARIFHSGQSQQGGSIVTYASAFHDPEASDGYFVQTAGVARAINGGVSCTAQGAPAFPDCTPALEGDQRLVRTDLPVPVYRMQTETDLAVLGVISGGTRQEDSDGFRYYELAGAAHTPVHEVELFGLPISLATFCAEELNSLADGPVFGAYAVNAMWESLERQVEEGTPPPRGERVKTVGNAIARDVFGNALGGVRMPELDVPVATYGPTATVSPDLLPIIPFNLANLFCVLTGTTTPFEEPLLALLYPTRNDFLGPYFAATDALVEARFLLPEDAALLKARAVPEAAGAWGAVATLTALAARSRARSRRGRRSDRPGRDFPLVNRENAG